MDYAEIVNEISRLAVEAGDLIMQIYDGPDFEIRAKSDDSPVTAADEAADAHIAAGLASAFPDIPIVTEEQADTHTGAAAEVFFIVDPLDGTKEFIKRRGEFTVNIALVENGVPTRGVVYAPAIGRMFLTRADGRSVEVVDGAEQPMSVTERHDNGLKVVASKSHRDAATDAYINRYDVAEFASAGSSLKFCLVAAGEADIYPRLGRTMEWDTAAGHAVVLGAGGRVDRLDRSASLTYGKPGYENPFFVVYTPWVSVLQA